MQFEVKDENGFIDLGIYLANRRLELEISERDLSRFHGLQSRTINKIESGENCNTRSLFKYCNALGVSLIFKFDKKLKRKK